MATDQHFPIRIQKPHQLQALHPLPAQFPYRPETIQSQL
ncbi:uncharacterized protein METZ01_LOCUS181216 [marine metagenome]|uniref:Uncharacterized protein n=1 Tax=marine metagenome TaxID=408172 RepID=A0A382CRD0_9ZZZZ